MCMFDKDLRPEHIQSISNADEVAGFFSYLGYTTAERIKQSPSNLGITNDSTLKNLSDTFFSSEKKHSSRVLMKIKRT
jgi:hypothetical protein